MEDYSYLLFNRYIVDKEQIRVYDTILKKYIYPYGNGKQIYLPTEKKTYSYRKLYQLAYNQIYTKDNIKDLPEEEWRQSQYADYIYISNYGRVKSYYYYNANLQKLEDNGSGYYRVDIKGDYYLIHKLVMELFSYDIKDNQNYEIHHKDFNKQNNNISNLIYLTEEAHRRIHNEENQKLKSQKEEQKNAEKI